MQDQSYKFTLGGMLKFECISLFGRMFLAKFRTPDFTSQKFATASNYLNLGCGSNILGVAEINGGGGGKYC